MAKTQPKRVRVRKTAQGVAFLCLVATLAIGIAGYLGWQHLGKGMEFLAGTQFARLSAIENLSRDLVSIRQAESGLLLAAAGIAGSDGREVARELKAGVAASGQTLRTLRNLGAEGEFQRPLGEMEKIQAELNESLEPLLGRLLAGATLATLGAEYQAFDKGVNELGLQAVFLKKAVLKEIEKSRQEVRLDPTLWFIPGVASLLLLIGALVLWQTGRRRAVTAGQLLEGIRAVGTGFYDDVKVDSQDELGEIARAFNEAMSRLRGSIVTPEEREATQANIIHFLDVVSEAAEGDLTVKAPVTADAFGSIADAYNLMVDSLGGLLVDTRRRAEEVGREAVNLLEIFRAMEKGAESQAAQVEEGTRAVTETSAATSEISRKATLAQEASSRVDEVTGKGNKQVLRNIEGMQLIRVTVQTINKKMKSLSERLLEIGTISQLISDIATRTTILAMNASIEASRAGEQGRGFLVISDEIKKLADRSAEATKQIGGIIKAIQLEAGEVTAALEEETATVEAQTRLAQDTGEAFSEIEQAISDSKAVVREIFDLSGVQQELTNRAVSSMEEVSRISGQAIGMVKESSAISRGLGEMSETLQKSLSRFRLPQAAEAPEKKVAPAPEVNIAETLLEAPPQEEIELELELLEEELFPEADADAETEAEILAIEETGKA